MSIAVLAYGDTGSLDSQLGDLSDPSELVGALLSPMALVAVAIGIRLSVGFIALVAAYPLTRSVTRADYPTKLKSGSFVRLFWDRIYMATAFRSLRRTWAVRQLAAERLGPPGQLWLRAASWIRWSGLVFFLLLMAVLANTGS